MNRFDEIVKEFYGQYGFAMHNSQMLERGLLELYALHKYINDKLTYHEYYLILSNPKKWTLGTIINKMNSLNIFSEENKILLKQANKNRIFLAHMFWWERNIKFDKNEELIKLHIEISNYIELFDKIIKIINRMIISLRTKNNIKIEEEMGLTDFNERELYIKSLKEK